MRLLWPVVSELWTQGLLARSEALALCMALAGDVHLLPAYEKVVDIVYRLISDARVALGRDLPLRSSAGLGRGWRLRGRLSWFALQSVIERHR